MHGLTPSKLSRGGCHYHCVVHNCRISDPVAKADSFPESLRHEICVRASCSKLQPHFNARSEETRLRFSQIRGAISKCRDSKSHDKGLAGELDGAVPWQYQWNGTLDKRRWLVKEGGHRPSRSVYCGRVLPLPLGSANEALSFLNFEVPPTRWADHSC